MKADRPADERDPVVGLPDQHPPEDDKGEHVPAGDEGSEGGVHKA